MFRIKKLDIFIAKQFGLLFVGTFFICLFVLMMQFLWRYVDELIGKGLSMEILAQFFWYMALGLMPQAFPLAILLSSLIAYGNLGESSELTRRVRNWRFLKVHSTTEFPIQTYTLRRRT